MSDTAEHANDLDLGEIAQRLSALAEQVMGLCQEPIEPIDPDTVEE
ncbi:hypothetical protein [Agrobacterium larrymoorei]|uniref:Uncharacterized protein n=1 Tax=Agrobacterium larrymoorei TaxID=160699 RepID=A0ABX8T609_9HYPH|nr:hypothetical protein [Agrobacterium larrymoorei]QYA08699.1 hypothetical protein J5285_14805 [Agrobacterium larrymoorei]